MALIAREASIAYGGFVVGGDQASHILRDIFTSDDGYETGVIDFTFTVQQETVALFAADCAAAEAAFSIPHQNLTLTGLGSKSWSQSGRTGFNAVPNLSKFGHPSDSGLSRTYRARIEVGKPAGNSSSSGRRVTRTGVDVSYGPQRRRTVTISGEWTGLGGVSARTQYEAQVSTYAATVLAELTGTYKLLHEPQTTHDDANNVIRISITYEEILNTSVGGSDADIRAESVIISRGEAQPGDTPGASFGFVTRVATMSAQYDAYLNKSDTDIRSKWTSTLRGRLLTLIGTTFGAGAVVVVSEDPRFDYTDNRVTASMTCLGIPSGPIIESRATTEHDTDEGIVLVPIWDGDPYSRYQYQGPAAEIRTVHIIQKVLGQIFTPYEPVVFPDIYSGRGDLILKKKTTSSTPENLGGTRNGTFQVVSTITETRVYERAKVKNAGRPPLASGGGTGGNRTDRAPVATVGASGGGGTGGGKPQ